MNYAIATSFTTDFDAATVRPSGEIDEADGLTYCVALSKARFESLRGALEKADLEFVTLVRMVEKEGSFTLLVGPDMRSDAALLGMSSCSQRAAASFSLMSWPHPPFAGSAGFRT